MGRHVAVLSLLLAACSESSAPGPDTAGPSDAEITAVAEFEIGSVAHVLDEVDYPIRPPVGGDHFPVWQNCGVYTEEIIDEVAVHSLEHGAVWVAFPLDASAELLDQVTERATGETHLLASPHAAVESGLVLSAWGRRLEVQSWTEPSVETFLQDHLGRRSPTAPEAGASCEGGVGAAPDLPELNYDAAVAQFSESG